MINGSQRAFQRQPGDESEWDDIPPERESIRSIPKFTFAQLRDQNPTLDDPVVEPLFRAGETVNIVSYSKVGKSWLLYGLILSIVTGRPWLGKFFTRPGKVLLIDNELRKGLLASRIRTVAEAMGLLPHEYETLIEVWPLRGNLRGLPELGIELEKIPPGTFKAVCFDAKYRLAVPGQSENDNASETLFYNELDRHAERLNAAMVLIHHASKGDQSGKRVTDIGSGAGAQSRACDAHLVLREHEEDDCVVLDGAVRSFPPVAAEVLRWCFPLWQPQEHLNPLDLKKPKSGGDERQERQDRQGREAVLKAIPKGEQRNRRQLRQSTGISFDRLNRLIAQLLDSEDIRISDTTEAKNREVVEWFTLTV